MTMDAAAHEELEKELLHALRIDHSHTTRNEAQVCHTCLRRTAKLLEVIERWYSWHIEGSSTE